MRTNLDGFGNSIRPGSISNPSTRLSQNQSKMSDILAIDRQKDRRTTTHTNIINKPELLVYITPTKFVSGGNRPTYCSCFMFYLVFINSGSVNLSVYYRGICNACNGCGETSGVSSCDVDDVREKSLKNNQYEIRYCITKQQLQ